MKVEKMREEGSGKQKINGHQPLNGCESEYLK